MHIRGTRAFTLLELSAVLALIGLLSAAAVPSLSRMIHRGRHAEARALVESIAHAELRHQRDLQKLLPCKKTPEQTPHGTTAAFVPDDNWRALGVAVEGEVAYSYSVEVSGDSFTVTATGDLDGDGKESKLVLDGKTLAITETDALE